MIGPTASVWPRSTARSRLGTSNTASAGPRLLLRQLAESGTPLRELSRAERCRPKNGQRVGWVEPGETRLAIQDDGFRSARPYLRATAEDGRRTSRGRRKASANTVDFIDMVRYSWLICIIVGAKPGLCTALNCHEGGEGAVH